MDKKAWAKLSHEEQRVWLKAHADKVIPMTMAEAKALPGMLAPLISGQFVFQGYCARNAGGEKRFYELVTV